MLTMENIFSEISENGGSTPCRKVNEIASRFPEKVAFRDKRFGIWSEISYQSFWEQAQWVGCALNYFGVDRFDKAAVHSENRPEWIIADIGIQSIRAITVGERNSEDDFISIGGGSGVVINERGLIITNHHVIDEATDVRVIFEDGRMYEAKIIGSDKLTDIGVIKIENENLTPISIGNSKGVFVGDLAVAIGHPLTLGAAPTVTTGVISALDRRLDVGSENMNNPVTLFGLIQTDAPITRGSSGGALLNNNGELIGITTAIATADVGAEGLGFAVPINLALGIVEDILDDGKVLHAFLGILGAQYFEVAEDGARIFSGVLIEELYGPANDIYAIGKAGALPGDVIKKINDEKISTLDQLITILRNKRAGDEITVEILRNQNIITLDFTLDLRPSDV